MSYNNAIPRVLVIDDNRDIHTDFRKILCRSDDFDEEFEQMEALFDDAAPSAAPVRAIEIDSAYQGQEGFEMVKQALADGRPYSLAFIDVRMPPGWDGIETTGKIWEVDPEIQVVVCSAYSDYSWQDIVNQLEHSDRFLVLKKPFESIEVRQLVAALHQRWYDARSDVLTGLVNRRAFMDHFHRQEQACEEAKIPLSCVMIDMDFFKRVNDNHGHTAGDEVLRAVAEALVKHSRQGDLVARYGGEEMCVLLKNADEEAAASWANRVRESIAVSPIKTSDKPIYITASFGVAELKSINGEETSPELAMERADLALRTAKDLGRNQVVKHSSIAGGKLLASDTNRMKVFKGIKAAEVMHPTCLIDRDATLKDAAESLMSHNLTSAPVIDGDGQVIGLLTERDLLESFSGVSSESMAAHKIMQSSVVCYPENTSLQEIFDFLVRVAIPQVVIVRDGRPQGMIARTTLLKWLCSVGFASKESQQATPPTLPLIEPTGDVDMPSTTES